MVLAGPGSIVPRFKPEYSHPCLCNAITSEAGTYNHKRLEKVTAPVAKNIPRCVPDLYLILHDHRSLSKKEFFLFLTPFAVACLASQCHLC